MNIRSIIDRVCQAILSETMPTQRFMAPTMDVRVHGAIPDGSEDILTPEALR